MLVHMDKRTPTPQSASSEPRLAVMDGGKDDLGREAVHALAFGRIDEADAIIERIRPRGRLTSVPASATTPGA